MDFLLCRVLGASVYAYPLEGVYYFYGAQPVVVRTPQL